MKARLRILIGRTNQGADQYVSNVTLLEAPGGEILRAT